MSNQTFQIHPKEICASESKILDMVARSPVLISLTVYMPMVQSSPIAENGDRRFRHYSCIWRYCSYDLVLSLAENGDIEENSDNT